jgi:hypothetical protein
MAFTEILHVKYVPGLLSSADWYSRSFVMTFVSLCYPSILVAPEVCKASAVCRL